MLQKCNEIWDKISNLINKRFDSEPVYKKKYIQKTKVKPYEGKVNTNFHNDKIPEESSYYICQSVVLRTIILKCF